MELYGEYDVVVVGGGTSSESPYYQVDVSCSNGVWTAVCDKLGLVTEADKYEDLIDRAWDIAEELYVENGLGSDTDALRLSFIHAQDSRYRMVK